MTEKERQEIIAAVKRLLIDLDNDELAAVALITGYSLSELQDLGGLE